MQFYTFLIEFKFSKSLIDSVASLNSQATQTT